MAYSELDKRLLKRAVQVEARRVLIKRAAGEFLDLFSSGMSNEEVGGALATHLQAMAAYRPGTPEFNRYVAENNLRPETAQALSQIGTKVVQLARDPSTYHITGGKFDAEAINKLLASPQGQAIKNQIYQGFEPGDGLNYARHQGVRAGLAENTPAYQQQLKEQEAYRNSLSPWNPMRLIPAEASTGIGLVVDGFRGNTKQYEDQVRSQIMQGFGQGINTNSPLARQIIAQGATGYLENKINQWAPRDSTFGRGANSIGKFLLGLFSMMPGYESIVNWLANRDFMFGKELRALPGQVQAQGARMLSGGTAPQQTAQPQQITAPTPAPPPTPRQITAPTPAPPPTPRQPAPTPAPIPTPPATPRQPAPTPAPIPTYRPPASHNDQNKPAQ